MISKEPYRSLIFIEERDRATLYSYDSDRRVQDSLTYDLYHSDGDLYEFTPFSSEDSATGLVPKFMEAYLAFEGRIKCVI